MFKKKVLFILGNMLLISAGTLTSLFMAEYAIKHKLLIKAPLTPEGRFDYNEQYRLSALARGETYDTRTIVEVISTERLLNKRVFPAASPAYFLSSTAGSSVIVDNEPVLPMGITALADNYYCNESGKFAKFVTDQYGFRNNQKIWTEKVDIVAVGDSFTMGSCLDDDLSIIGQIRQKGKKILNLGMGSNGPLIELASLKEFGLGAKPQVILWNFFENDLSDLIREKDNPILIKYLNSGFSQNLKNNSDKINSAVDKVVENYWKSLEANAKNKTTSDDSYFPNIKKVYLYLKSLFSGPQPNYTEALDLFLKVIAEAKTVAKENNSELIFTYLPDCLENSYHQNKWKSQLISSVQNLGIKVVDLTSKIEKAKDSEKGAFFSCPGSHFNEAGARIAADEIVQSLGPILK